MQSMHLMLNDFLTFCFFYVLSTAVMDLCFVVVGALEIRVMMIMR